MNLTESQKTFLQSWYDSCRNALNVHNVNIASVQLSFESVVLSFFPKKGAWRPTHISSAAAEEILKGRKSNIQRAHGALEGRLDRRKRTESILRGPHQAFESWFGFFEEHDKTVLVTKEEHHKQKKVFKESELIKLPDWKEDMFTDGSKSIRLRLSKELKWLRENT